MANRKATFAKRQRETDLKDRAKQKEDRRTQKRGEVRENKGPQIAWDEAVYAVTSDDPPPLDAAKQGQGDDEDGGADGEVEDAADGPAARAPAAPPAVATATPAAPTLPAAPAASPVNPKASAAPKKPAAAAKSGPVVTKPTASPNPASPRRVG